MTFRDLLEAEQHLFGDYGRNLSIRLSPGGEDEPDDIAAAFLRGDTQLVEKYVAAHTQQIRSRCVEVNGPKCRRGRLTTIDHAKVRSMRAQGLSCRDIANSGICSRSRAFAICREVRSDDNV